MNNRRWNSDIRSARLIFSGHGRVFEQEMYSAWWKKIELKVVRVTRDTRNLERVSSQALYQSTVQFSPTVSRKTSRRPTGAISTETALNSCARSTTASAFLLANTLI